MMLLTLENVKETLDDIKSFHGVTGPFELNKLVMQ